jgi:hypothetical protein
VDILVADVDWLERDFVVFVRLKSPIDLRLERHAPAKFVVVVMGNNSISEAAHMRHLEIGEVGDVTGPRDLAWCGLTWRDLCGLAWRDLLSMWFGDVVWFAVSRVT